MNYARPPTSRPTTRPEATHDSGTLHQNAFRTAARWDGRAARFGLKDVAHSLRLFRRSPGFTIAAVAALTRHRHEHGDLHRRQRRVAETGTIPDPNRSVITFRRASFNRAPHRALSSSCLRTSGRRFPSSSHA